MKLLLSLTVCAFVIGSMPSAHAAEKKTTHSKKSTRTTQPAKKPAHTYSVTDEDNVSSRSSSSGLPPAAVLVEGSNVVSARLGTGTPMYFGVGFEHMFTPNFGAIGDLRYGSYTSAMAGFGEWKLTVWEIAAQASFHADFLKVEGLDTFLSAGLGRTFVSSTWTGSTVVPVSSVTASAFEFIGYLNIRYFFADNFGVTAAVGTGMGTLNFGVDYLF